MTFIKYHKFFLNYFILILTAFIFMQPSYALIHITDTRIYITRDDSLAHFLTLLTARQSVSQEDSYREAILRSLRPDTHNVLLVSDGFPSATTRELTSLRNTYRGMHGINVYWTEPLKEFREQLLAYQGDDEGFINLDNCSSAPWPSSLRNIMDLIIMKKGLCLCPLRARGIKVSCGGLNSRTAKNFILRVALALRKDNPNALAYLHGFDHGVKSIHDSSIEIFEPAVKYSNQETGSQPIAQVVIFCNHGSAEHCQAPEFGGVLIQVVPHRVFSTTPLMNFDSQ